MSAVSNFDLISMSGYIEECREEDCLQWLMENISHYDENGNDNWTEDINSLVWYIHLRRGQTKKADFVRYMKLLGRMGLPVKLRDERDDNTGEYIVDIQVDGKNPFLVLLAINAIRYPYDPDYENYEIVDHFLRFAEDDNDATTLFNRWMLAHYCTTSNDHNILPYNKLVVQMTDETFKRRILDRDISDRDIDFDAGAWGNGWYPVNKNLLVHHGRPAFEQVDKLRLAFQNGDSHADILSLYKKIRDEIRPAGIKRRENAALQEAA